MYIRLSLTCVLLAGSVFAQSSTGTATMVGAVSDSTGSVVPGAKVTVTNKDAGFVFNSVTTPEGTWYIPNLNPGNYQLRIEAAGFKAYVQDGISLRTAEQPRIDVKLEIGSVAESIMVTGAPPLLETETATSGQVLEGQTIVKMPVLQKAFYRIYLYMPGMNVISSTAGSEQHAIGQRQRALGYTIDGVNAKEPVLGNPNNFDTVMTSSLDMIQEFKMYTTGLPAEFGHSSGGQLSGVMKSGTNQFHGSAEDRYLNGKLVHRQYFEQLRRCQASAFSTTIIPCNPFTYHEMGATAGGPIRIPHVYNGKDRTFFFGGFQRHHEKVTETFIGNVPSPDMYAGNFNFGGRGFPIYDPSTTRLVDGVWTRDPFPGNVIPQNRFDPVISNILGRNPWKQPNDPGTLTPNGPTNNLVVPTKGRYYITRFDFKVDHQFSSNNKVFGRYSQNRVRAPGRFSNELLWAVVDPVYVTPVDLHNMVLSDTHTFNPTTINEARFGWNSRNQTNSPRTQNGDWGKQLGMPNVSPETFPDILNGGSRYYNLGPGGFSERRGADFSFQDNVTKIVSKHTLKIGYELIRTTYDSLVETFPSGRYVMGGTDFPFRPNTGNAFANFLLGNVSSATFTQAQAHWQPRWWSHSFYVQDDYKPIRNLTINLGLRWSYESPFQTAEGKQAQFDPNVTDPLTGLKGAIVHKPGALAASRYNNWQPRLGVAYNFTPKWVFRGNFGIITADLLTSTLNNNFEEYLATASIQAPPGDPRTVFALSQGPPSIKFNLAQDGSAPFIGTNYSGRNATWFDPNMRMPYTMNWSGGFQYQMTNTWLAELLYQGSAGVGLLNNWDINVLPLDVSTDPARLNTIRTQYQNFKPYPQFGSIQHYSNYGHNTYHGMTLRAEKRYSSGMTINSFWTWSKTMDESDNDGGASGITWYNRKLEKGRASFDISHRWVSTVTYEIPFGKGRRFLNTGGWKNAVLGGWETVYSQTFQSGPPITISFAGTSNVYLPGASRPNQLKPNDEVKLAHVDIGPNRFPFSAQTRYLNINGFAYPASYTPGTLGRNTMQGPGIVWGQASLSKEWPIFERVRFNLRFDVNNVYKYHNFNAPNSTYNASDPSSFGTFNGTRGSFSDVGTGRWHGIMVFRVMW
jgi:hypothetical protein